MTTDFSAPMTALITPKMTSVKVEDSKHNKK